MSKKLIAVASAAALALSALVGMAPASASAPTIKVEDGATVYTNSTTKASAAVNRANTANELTFGTTGTVIKFTVTNPLATSSTITVNSDLGVRVLTTLTDANDDALASGAGSLSLTGSDSTATNDFVFYAYTNSTTAGSVSINVNANTSIHWVKGTAAAAYNLVAVKFPASVTGGTVTGTTKDVVSFEVTDVFGNKLDNVASGTAVGVAGTVFVGALGATADAVIYSTTKKLYESKIHTSTSTSVAMNVKITATDLSANGWPKPVDTAFSAVNAADLATQVTALTAQVAALTAQLGLSRLKENSVTQKKYNTLVRKWNAAFPSNKVALKK
jgi:hypothetical protein